MARVDPRSLALGACGAFLLAGLASFQGIASKQVIITGEQMEILGHMSIEYLDDGLGGRVKTIRIAGANLQLVNGLGATDQLDGTGNLIVGYNEPAIQSPGPPVLSGSHNVLAGLNNSYTSYGGFVAGVDNRIDGECSTVIGGRNNDATGRYATVLGGGNVDPFEGNTASGLYSVVCGGSGNLASGGAAAVLGGWDILASSFDAAVLGGQQNEASGLRSTVVGGLENTASGSRSSVSGGLTSVASSGQAVVSGGANNQSFHPEATVSGGCGLVTTTFCEHRPQETEPQFVAVATSQVLQRS